MRLRIQQIVYAILIIFSSANVYSQSSTESKKEAFRGFMIDAPRGVETMDYYIRLIDFCRDKEMNSIIFRLTDDQGSAYRFTSHPELKMCEGAFTADELRTLIKYAQKRGIEFIPEVESFGHTKYITQTEKYKFLNDAPEGADFNAICPVNDSSVVLMEDLYTEIASLFPSHYFHIGCDEVNWGASEVSKKALATKGRSRIWAAYVNRLNRILKGLGKTTVIWGDVPIYHEKEILELLDRDIVIIDWNYWESDQEKIKSVAEKILDQGFRLIACPAVAWCAWGPRVGEWQFKNMNAYAEVYGKLNNPNNLGIILSNWVPSRYLQNSQWDTYTIAAEIVKNKGNYSYMDAIPAYVKKHFGAEYDAAWEKAYKTIYEKTPEWGCGRTDSLKFFPWSSEKEIRTIIEKNRQIVNPFVQITGLLTSCRESVKTNLADFDDLFLTIEFMGYNYNRQNALLSFVNSGEIDLHSVQTFFREMSLADQNMLTRIDKAWRRGRYGNPKDKQYMWSFYLVSDYSKHLSENPSEFLKIVQKFEK